MKAGRESVWLVVPFTVGIAVVNYSLPLYYGHPSVAVTILMTSVAGIVLSVLSVWTDSKGTEIVRWRLAVGLLFFFAGTAVCVMANLEELIGMPLTDGASAEGQAEMPRIGLLINGCGARFRNMIEEMPFGDRLSNALVKALLAGDRSSLPRDVRNSFRAAGASHLLALSGLHLSVIYLVVSKILSLTGNSPAAVKVRSVVIILFSGFFTLITGASPSLMRAFLFIVLRECAVLSRRQTDNINIFCMSLTLQLALNPNDISSVGFQLSYLAMLGIFIVEPPLERFWEIAGDWLSTLRREKKEVSVSDEGNTEEDVVSDVPIGNVPENGTSSLKDKTAQMGTVFGNAMRKIWSLCALSISCQVFTAPAVLLYFGTFPRYFLITNLFCLPLSNMLITVSVIAVLLQMLGLCPAFLLHVIDFLVHTLVYILDTISTI